MEVTLFNNTQNLIEYFQPIANTMLNDSGGADNLAAKAMYAYGLGVPVRAIVGIIPHITIINGKPTADSHVVQALLRWNGIEYKTIEDMRPLYSYSYRDSVISQDDYDADKDSFKVFFSMEQFIANKTSVPVGITPIIRSPQPVDFRTKIEFTRMTRRIDGEFITQTEFGIFTWGDAATAGYLDKDNWKKHPRAMLYARAIAIGGRRIGDDYLKGLYDTTELLDVVPNFAAHTDAEIIE